MPLPPVPRATLPRVLAEAVAADANRIIGVLEGPACDDTIWLYHFIAVQALGLGSPLSEAWCDGMWVTVPSAFTRSTPYYRAQPPVLEALGLVERTKYSVDAGKARQYTLPTEVFMRYQQLLATPDAFADVVDDVWQPGPPLTEEECLFRKVPFRFQPRKIIEWAAEETFCRVTPIAWERVPALLDKLKTDAESWQPHRGDASAAALRAARIYNQVEIALATMQRTYHEHGYHQRLRYTLSGLVTEPGIGFQGLPRGVKDHLLRRYPDIHNYDLVCAHLAIFAHDLERWDLDCPELQAYLLLGPEQQQRFAKTLGVTRPLLKTALLETLYKGTTKFSRELQREFRLHGVIDARALKRWLQPLAEVATSASLKLLDAALAADGWWELPSGKVYVPTLRDLKPTAEELRRSCLALWLQARQALFIAYLTLGGRDGGADKFHLPFPRFAVCNNQYDGFICHGAVTDAAIAWASKEAGFSYPLAFVEKPLCADHERIVIE